MKSIFKKFRAFTFNLFYRFDKYKFFSFGKAWRDAGQFKLKVEDQTVILNPSSYLEYFRWHRLFSKEPETIQWVDSFESNAVFWDVGANVGVYSVYALLKHKTVNVVAFEPEPENFIRLVDNIARADEDRAIAYPVGLSSYSSLTSLNRSKPGEAGTSNNQVGSIGKSSLGCIALSLDELVSKWKMSCPQYIKIDVDGIELDILDGMKDLLKNPVLKSVLIESQNAKMAAQFDDIITKAGFKIQSPREIGRGNRIYAKGDLSSNGKGQKETQLEVNTA